MPVPLWPPPPTDKELAARRAAGATTWRELDPPLAKWAADCDRAIKTQRGILVFGSAGCAIAFIVLIAWRIL